MREIKFRAWVLESNKFIYKPPVPELTPSWAYRRGEYILEQYTGLKDKNGKEIFEGDITSLDGEYLAVIKWNEKQASFVAESIEGDYVSEHLYGAELCDVEGNIHENPELLEADK